MTKLLRDFRLLPIALIAIGCLLALKSIGLIFDGGYTLRERLGGSSTLVVTTVPVPSAAQMRSPAVPMEFASGQPAVPKQSWMKEMFNYPDTTGSVGAAKPAPKEPASKETAGSEQTGKQDPPPSQPPPGAKSTDGTMIPLDQSRPSSPGERALLERLQERRQQLDTRARELDMREGMLKAAEQKLGVPGATEKTGDGKSVPAGQRKEDADSARIKAVVVMYETMKPKDAAKIFDRLDSRVLLEVASQINPRRMSEIMAQMSPEAAERLTVELASPIGSADKGLNPANLPKIEGRPNGT
jgi:flagellar motility protein MotE (MotC chaperone)